jgi:hypothetical protein
MEKTVSKLAVAQFVLVCVLYPHNAAAIPSFAAQTNQPCSACHVGAYGPQLKPYGRDFKLYGYVTSDRSNNNVLDNWYERLSTSVWSSFNRTNKDMPPSPGGQGYGPNNNFSLDQIAMYYGGRISSKVGALAEFTYDGAENKITWDALDVRHAWEGELLGEDYVAGVLLGNQLGNTSIWNSSPPNGFPYNESRIIPGPNASALLDDTLNSQILGPGAYISWSDWLYAEAALYFPLSHNMDKTFGVPQIDTYVTPIPFWHLAIQKEFDHHKHYVQFGTFGASADIQPGQDQITGLRDHLTDIGLEANYQWMADMHNMISAHTSFIHEIHGMEASNALGSSINKSNILNEFKADLTYTIDDTYIPSLQYFRTTGSQDDLYYSSDNGYSNSRPNSEGFTIDLAYVPFGKPDSSFIWGNARLAAQYTAYTEFNGTSHNASDNNTLFFNLIFNLAPLAPIFSHDETTTSSKGG